MQAELSRLTRLEKLERDRLTVVLVAFAILGSVTLWLWQYANYVRLSTISQAPSYVPLWIQNYWIAVGLTTGGSTVLGAWGFAQLARWGRARQELRDSARERAPEIAGSWPSHAPGR